MTELQTRTKYVYDDMTRLQSASCGSVWSQTFSFDAFGNIAKSGSMSFSALYNPSTNRITTVGGFTPTYDANGNTLTDPSHSYTWDSAGRPVSIDSVNITYDALGRMVEQNRSGVYTQFAYGPGGTKFATLTGSSLQKAIVPLIGGAQVVYNSAGILYYGHSDHLGSIRLGSTTSRTAAFSLAYAPYGETYATTGSTDPAFTAQRQDTVSGIYDFPEREYAIYGRWISPDPAGLGSFHLTDPQSINRYAYARNNPLSMVDPTGLCSLVETDSKEPSQFSQFGLGFSWEEEDPPSTSCIDPGAGGGGGGGGSVAAPGSGPDPGSGIDPGQNPGTNNGPSSGDPSNSGQGCGSSASCGPPSPPDLGTNPNDQGCGMSGCIQLPSENPAPPLPLGLTVSLLSQNPLSLNPNQLNPGDTLQGILTSSQPLSSGAATATVTLFAPNGAQAMPGTVGLVVGISQPSCWECDSSSQQYNQISAQVPTGSNNGSFGFTGPGTLTFTVTDSQGNQFDGYFPVTVGTSVGQTQKYLPGSTQPSSTQSGGGGASSLIIP